MDIEVHGETHPDFASIKTVFASLWLDVEVGASLCVYHKNSRVVDLWAGFTDRDLNQAWEADTLVNVYSATKGIASFACAMLFEQKQVHYEDKVIKYWPEFGAEGKHNITIAQLLSHQAGLCGVDSKLEVSDLYNFRYISNLLAAQRPYWHLGDGAGYHAVTWGFLVGELFRRISGQTLKSFIAEQIATPLQADIFVGLPRTEYSRCAPLIGPNHSRRPKQATDSAIQPKISTPQPNATSLFHRALMNPPISPFKDACSDAWRDAEIVASNGHASARGLAKVYAAMANNGSIDGIKLCAPKAIHAACQSEVETGRDKVLGQFIRRSRGFILNTNKAYGPCNDAFGHAGAGGSMAFADPHNHLSFSYVMNQMRDDAIIPRSKILCDELYKNI